ncbi:interleukin-7 receptor subunit alpha isoform X2 [Mastacembelus armatus]|uniref:Interleukin 7 receptor n=1 Tax=Mastacembelus armatus TaxID=205130 RepID=A0A3Q3LWE3_9TELE|nr:interleukin-7 receptor subunit alpha isoform X2 [Mastacembelus armatus]
MFGWRFALLLLLPIGTRAQSGDGDADTEPRISCTSHITKKENSLSCRLLGTRPDDEDDEDDEDEQVDGIERMSLCYNDLDEPVETCFKNNSDTLLFKETPVIEFNLTVHLKRGGSVSTNMDLKKIVKPNAPQVWNVTFNQDSKQVVILIRTPYHKDYLKVENQLFQLHICTEGSEMTQNISSSDTMMIDMERLQKNTEYQVRVRAIPLIYLQGSWSKWSEPYSFFSPPELSKGQRFLYLLIMGLIFVVTLVSSVVVLCKNKIFTYMWPRIPHPKHTLVQIYKPNTGLLLHFSPEVFSALTVFPQEKAEEQPIEDSQPSIGSAAADRSQSSDPCSTQSSDCRSTNSVSTEELELSALLSQSSSDGEDGSPITGPSPINVPQPGDGHEAETLGVSQQEEAYVTMSRFYQIK